MRTTDLADFSGGIREVAAPGDFTDRQWAQLKGFVITDESQIRSQWPIQKVGDEGGFVDIRPLTGQSGRRYVVGIKSNGTVWYTSITTLTATTSAATAAALTWTQLTKPGGGALTLTDTPRFLGETAYITASNGRRTGLLIHSVFKASGNGSAPVVVYENSNGSALITAVYEDGSGNAKVFPGYLPAAPSNVTTGAFNPAGSGSYLVSWTPGAPGSSAITGYIIYDSTGAQRATAAAGATSVTVTPAVTGESFLVRASNTYGTTPLDAGGGVQPPSPGYIPRANLGVLWSGQLILADIQYYKSPTDAQLALPLTANNTTRLSNGIWFSNTDEPDTFDPLAVFTVGSADATITGMVVIPQGLLVLTTSPTQGDGLFLLRGRSIGVVNAENVDLNFTLELLRGAIGSVPRDDGRGNALAVWPTIGTAVFINENGGVWHTNTQDILQLDAFGAAITAPASQLDNLCTIGRYLVASRNGRLIVMREFGQAGSWTELVYPGTVQPTSLSPMEGSVYFIADYNVGGGGKVYRIVTNAAHANNASERGLINGAAVDLTVSTRTLGDPKRFEKSMWHRFGMRARGIRNAVLKSFTVSGGAWYAGAFAPLATSYSPAKSIDDRFEVVVPAHGPSIECHATIVVQGDVEIESMTAYDHGRMPRRK